MVTRNYPAMWTLRALHLFFQYFTDYLMFFSPFTTQQFPTRFLAILIWIHINEHTVHFPWSGPLGSFLFLGYFSSCFPLINTDFCLCSFMCLTGGSRKAFSSVVLWNSLYPMSCFISFIFKSWLIPMANASFLLVFRYLQANFLHCACTYSLGVTVCRGSCSSSCSSSQTEKPHWPREQAHWEGLPDHPCLLSVALEPLDLLSQSSIFVPLPALMFLMRRHFVCMEKEFAC